MPSRRVNDRYGQADWGLVGQGQYFHSRDCGPLYRALGLVRGRCRARMMESVLESHGPHELLELSSVPIGLGTTELRVDNEMQIDAVTAGRHVSRSDLRTLWLDNG